MNEKESKEIDTILGEIAERLLWVDERLEDTQDNLAEYNRLLTNHITGYTERMKAIEREIKLVLWISGSVMGAMLALAVAVLVKFLFGG